MRQIVMHAPGDVRVEDRAEPTIIEPVEAVTRLSAKGAHCPHGVLMEPSAPSPRWPADQAAVGYRAMDRRIATRVILTP